MKIPNVCKIVGNVLILSPRLALSVIISVLLAVPLAARASVATLWPATTEACDSLVGRLERLSGYVVDEQLELVGRLYALAKASPEVKAVGWRALYWDAVAKHDRKQVGPALVLIRRAEAAVDRKRFEYDYRRIRRSRMLFELGANNDLYGLYSAQYADLDYFTRIGDKKGMGNCHLMIGKVLIDIGEPLRALGENVKAVGLFRESDTPALLASAEMNMALCHLRLGEIDKGAYWSGSNAAKWRVTTLSSVLRQCLTSVMPTARRAKSALPVTSPGWRSIRARGRTHISGTCAT